MARNTLWYGAAATGLVTLCLAAMASAAEPSGCVTCHLDKEMLVKNLSGDKPKASAMQSGAG